ncbi:MAG: RluA family pseudouridine synthase [Candidatus Neomarinimicrobiota bacterium]|nr:MAG: RluA family pseudouridine synthase [Candidatus Neomarinimicrobiota bacterium]
MSLKQFIVDQPDTRLDVFLATFLPECSRSRLQKIIRQGLVTVDGRVQRPGYRLRPGEQVLVEALPEPDAPVLEPVPMDLDILYEDEALVVINKPAGLTVHPGVGTTDPTLVAGLMAHFNSLSDVNGKLRPGLVHRLDRDTSGALLIAKTNSVHVALAEQFQQRTVKKRYVGLTWGHWEREAGTLDFSLQRKRSDPTAYRVSSRGKRAVTVYRVVQELSVFSLVDFYPKTGRTHQIRVHAAHQNHPIVGDEKYDGGLARLKGYLPEVRRSLEPHLAPLQSRHFLHAAQLQFLHPHSGELLSIEAPLPDSLSSLLDHLKQVQASLE